MTVKPKPKQMWRAKDGTKQATQNKCGRPSEGAEDSWKYHSFKALVVRPTWLVDSWVGIMRAYRRMEVLKEELMRLGLGSIRIRYVGDKAVLLKARMEPPQGPCHC